MTKYRFKNPYRAHGSTGRSAYSNGYRTGYHRAAGIGKIKLYRQKQSMLRNITPAEWERMRNT